MELTEDDPDKQSPSDREHSHTSTCCKIAKDEPEAASDTEIKRPGFEKGLTIHGLVQLSEMAQALRKLANDMS